jgi:hypothetical protein
LILAWIQFKKYLLILFAQFDLHGILKKKVSYLLASKYPTKGDWVRHTEQRHLKGFHMTVPALGLAILGAADILIAFFLTCAYL